MIGKGISKFKGNHAATHQDGAADPISVDQGMIAAGAVGQAELKTSTGSVSISTTTCANGASGYRTLPGGSYGFYVQAKYSGYDVYCHGFVNASMDAESASYRAQVYLSITGSVNYSYTVYCQQRYITASGEVHWLFILRRKADGFIESMWQAPDHPCFGNGGKPELTLHPFSDFDPETQEILVVTMTPDEFEKIEDDCYDTDGLKILDLLEVIAADYDIDDSIEPPWPEIPVTVGLPRKAKLQPGEKVQPIKKRVPKPAMVRTARLKPRI